MKRMDNVSQRITKYIKDNNIPVAQIVYDTGISEEKILNEELAFNATEFLEICSYLNLRPEDIKEYPGE
ncbi:MAG: helix-turn-helix domain-containing protein [Eubacterium sp.]